MSERQTTDGSSHVARRQAFLINPWCLSPRRPSLAHRPPRGGVEGIRRRGGERSPERASSMLPRSLTVYSRARDPGEPPPALPASLSSRTTSHPAMEVPTGAPSWAARAGGGSPADEPIGHDGRRRGGGRRREWKGEKRACDGARRSRSSSRDRRCMQMDDVGACPWEASSARARVRSRRKIK